MLSHPTYLRDSGAEVREIHFTWDDWDTEAVEESADDLLVDSLRNVSDRGCVALAAAMAEWVVHRFGQFEADPLPWQFIEAAWAAEIDGRYLANRWDAVADEDYWNGPVRGPIVAAMMALDEVIATAITGGDLSDGTRWISNIAVHVHPRPQTFLAWRNENLTRLQGASPRRPGDAVGDVVPRELFDVKTQFQPAQTETLVNQFLRRLDHQTNPFLAAPQELTDLEPAMAAYTFDATRDRSQRADS